MWLLKQDVAQRMQHALKHLRPTAEQLSEFASRRMGCGSSNAAPSILTVAGDVAEIAVEGVLTAKPDFWSWFIFGENTTYEDIRASIALAAADPNVKRVEFRVNSPGGQVDGLFDTLAAIEAFKSQGDKPVSVRAGLAASAAYAISAVAGEIEATNRAAEFGSIGVAVSFYVDEHVVDITSTNAPNKRPDVTTEEGKAVVREELDAIHELFVEAIAKGRSVTSAHVNKKFGRGSVLLAEEAMKQDMIDAIATPPRAGAASSLPAAGRAAAASTETTPAMPGKDDSKTENNMTIPKSITAKLSLVDGADESSVLAAITKLQEQVTASSNEASAVRGETEKTKEALETATAIVDKLEVVTGKKGDEAIGTVHAWKASAEKLPKVEQENGELKSQNDDAALAKLIDDGRNGTMFEDKKPRLTKASADDLEKKVKGGFAARKEKRAATDDEWSLSQARAFVSALPPVPHLSAETPKPSKEGSGQPGGAGATALCFKGKAYEALSNLERAELLRDDEGLFAEMRKDWEKRGCPTTSEAPARA